MPRISHNVPMQAYDHITSLLSDAGGKDGVISRSDADQLVSTLRKAGNGTTALATKNLFTMIDARDAAPGARVTQYDLNKNRSFVANKMLENRDINHNGYSKAEIAKMSPTGRALVELGQILGIAKTPGRISHTVLDNGLNHVATLLKGATGNDGVLSKADLKALSSSLYKQGRGVESQAVSYFGGFIDHRDAAPGARITEKDINKAVAYAGKHMIDNKDKNNNGFSKDEIAKLSTTAKTFLQIGQMINAKIISP